MSNSEKRILTEEIILRLTKEQKEYLTLLAETADTTKQEIIRKHLDKIEIRSSFDLQAVQELIKTRADLGRIGGLLKLSLNKTFVNPTEIRNLLKKIEKTQQNLNKKIKKVLTTI